MSENVFLFVPNIIGFARVFLTVLSCFFMANYPSGAMWCYFIGSFLDAFDGHAARYFNQSTKFGAMLDQLTDRCGTACLMVMLSVFYPSYAFFFQMSIAVDIAMHWLHLHTSLLQGKESHKNMKDEPYILQMYYTSRPLLFAMCAGNETFYIALYLINFYDSIMWKLLAIVCFPIAVAKWLIAIYQGVTAAKNLAAIDVAERRMAETKSQ